MNCGAMHAQARRSRTDSRRRREVELLQIAEAAVQRAVVMKGRAAPEVVTIDKRDVQAARGRVPRGHQPADPAADHQDVESARRQRVKISDHAGNGPKHPAL
jgi:hypothetical protein